MKAYTKYLLAAAAIAMFGTAAQAADMGNTTQDNYAAMGLYLRADAGWSFLNWSGGSFNNDNDLSVGGGIGYRFNDNLRTDLRVDYSGSYKVAPGANMHITTTTGNLYFDIPTSTAITPYLGAGAGYSWAPVSGGYSDRNGFAAALMAGVGFNLSDSMTLDVGYRFVDTFSRKGANPMEHQVLAGIRYQF